MIIMTLEIFKKKHQDLFDLGVCQINEHQFAIEIIIDRFNGKEFLCPYNRLKPAQADARKMGFINGGIGFYFKAKTKL